MHNITLYDCICYLINNILITPIFIYFSFYTHASQSQTRDRSTPSPMSKEDGTNKRVTNQQNNNSTKQSKPPERNTNNNMEVTLETVYG